MALVLIEESGIAQLQSSAHSGSALMLEESGIARLKSQMSGGAALLIKENGIVRLQSRSAGIAIIPIGSNIGIGVNTVVVTVPAGGVPSGAVIGVVISDTSNVGGTIADTAGDGFLTLSEQSPGNTVTGTLGYSASGNVLAPGDTITYTLGQAGKSAAVMAFYVTGANIALGNGVAEFLATNTGTSAAPSEISAVPVQSGEILVAMVASASAVVSFTQDTTNAAWATPPGQVSIITPTLVGGSVINPTLDPYTYAPLFGASVAWAALMMGVRPA